MIVTAHQPNFLPGRSVIDKIAVSDAIIWLDEVQYTKGGFTNRNRTEDGTWLTIPVERLTDGKPINRVRIAEKPEMWRRKMSHTLWQNYGDLALPVRKEVETPYKLLLGLNVAVLRHVLEELKVFTAWHFQSHLDGGHAVQAVSEDAEALLPISDRLAMMVQELGGDTYLSGPSGRRYLDETPFNERGIKVEYFQFAYGNNVNAMALINERAVSR